MTADGAPTPPAGAEWLARRFLGSRDSALFILADLREEYAARVAAGRPLVSAWYCGVALLLGVRMRWSGDPHPHPGAEPGPVHLSIPSGDHMRLEIRLALRALLRRPLLSGAMVLTIGLALAAAVTVFTVVRGVLLAPLPYESEERLVAVWERNLPRGRETNVVSPANFLAWRDEIRSFDAIAAVVQYGATLVGETEPEQVGVMLASAEYFTMVGARPLVGRLYTASDDEPQSEAVAMLSEGFWRRRFGADSGVVGRRLSLNGQPVVIVGVLPARADFAPRAASFFSTGGRDLWVPPRFPEAAREAGGRYLQVIARLTPEATLEGARAELSALAAHLRESEPDRQAGWDVTLLPLKEDLVGDVRQPILLVFAAVVLVLLVAAANVADLQLTRTVERAREMAVRAALGAGRGRLLRQLLTEGVMLAGAGVVIGLILARAAVTVLVTAGPDLPRLEEVSLSPLVLLFAAVVAGGSALAFGLAPVLALGQGGLTGALGQRSGATRPRARTARRVLVGAQVALSFILLVGASLLGRSMLYRLNVDLGISPHGVVRANVSLPSGRFPTPVDRERFFEGALERLGVMPGVEVASAGSIVPMAGSGQATGFRALDRAAPAPGEAPVADVRFVHHRYHQAMGIDIVAGRSLQAGDRPGAPLVVLINETGARELWPGGSAIGQRIAMEWGELLEAEIIGVVRDVHLHAPDVPVDRATLYWDYRQVGVPGAMTLVARGDGQATTLLASVRRAVRETDASVPVFNAGTMEELVASALARARFAAGAFGAFALLALLLAMIGLYGVMASTTQQRTHEIGIRMALGASGREVRGLVLRQGLAVIAPALALGAAASVALSGFLRSMVFGVSPGDLATYLTVAGVLGVTAMLACWIPARRASAVDPTEAIRAD